MNLKQNLLKNISSIAIGFGLIGFTAFTGVAKAEEPEKCIDAIGAKVDGKGRLSLSIKAVGDDK